MAILYKQMDVDGETIAVYGPITMNPGSGIGIHTSFDGCLIADDEIPGLVGALQNYMSKRAKQITRAAKAGSR